YGCADKNGRFLIVDVKDPAAPKEINSAETPNRTTHNAWLSDDSQTLFTTDEKLSAFITSFDISDTKNIQLLGKVRADDYQSAVPHNATVLGDYIFSSYYNQGVMVFDASFPENMIEVASYSTCEGSMGQFDGAWGIYPYLPSGNILVSDMNTGLHIIRVDLKKASYLSGTVRDDVGSPIFNAQIHFKDDKSSVYTDMSGIYKTGKNTDGMRSVEVSALGYESVNMDVNMRSGVLNIRDVVLKKDDSGNSAQMETYVKAYPNPFYADRLLNVDYSFKEGIDGAAYLIIMDLSGRELYREELYACSGVVVVGKELPKGTYLLRVFNGALYSRVIKIVKA
ncbi:MAG: carboxypeptidase-like regulatory domain-containing protein, partial [Flavobacteriales bacterium]|nr:carboxypeptidase-like regulatory domain-containing protein [Flavobacteriales bacterium]